MRSWSNEYLKITLNELLFGNIEFNLNFGEFEKKISENAEKRLEKLRCFIRDSQSIFQFPNEEINRGKF